MNREFIENRFGNPVPLGICIVGRDIDNVAVRGFAALDALAAISAPDVFDNEINPTGTQRDLKPKHADASFAYATAEPSADERKTRAFPEVLLNVRDMQYVELRDIESGQPLMFDSHSPAEQLPDGCFLQVEGRGFDSRRAHSSSRNRTKVSISPAPRLPDE